MRTAADALIMSAAFSAIAFTTAHGWPDTCVGNTEASTHRSPIIPWTRKVGSTTLSEGDLPMRADETCAAAWRKRADGASSRWKHRGMVKEARRNATSCHENHIT